MFNLIEDLLNKEFQFLVEDRERYLSVFKELLGGAEVHRNMVLSNLFGPLLPTIGATLVDVNRDNLRLVFVERFSSGVVYEDLTREELDKYGFKKVLVHDMIPVYTINRHMRDHFTKNAKRVLLLNSGFNRSPDLVTIDSLQKRAMLYHQGNASLALLCTNIPET